MELQSHGIEINGVNKETDKSINPELKGISAQQSSQIPVEECNAQGKDETLSNSEDLNKGTGLDSTFSFPSLSRDLNSVPSEVAEVVGTENNPPDEFINEQGSGFDDMVILDDGVVTSACLSGEGVGASSAKTLEASQPVLPSSTVVSEAVAEIKDASKPMTIEGVCLSETNTEVEKKDPVEENLDARTKEEMDIEPPLTQEKGKDGITPIVSSSETQPMVVDESGEYAQEENPKVFNSVQASNLPSVVGDDSQKVVSVGETNVTEEDIHSIKGQKVKKRFGKKSYSGDVVDYDPETKWFKVIYEDGDEEDLELWEVREILASSENTPATNKKRSRAEDEEQQKSSKRPKKAGVESTVKKASKSGVKSPSKSLKDSKKPSTIKSSKGKSVPPKSSEVSRSLNLQTPKSQKQPNSSSKKNSKSPSTAKQQKPVAKEKVEEAGKDGLKASVTESGTNQKNITSGDDVYVGKHVKKDFDGKFYDGVVLKFDKKTQYYKVKYEDGDQEELELHELQPILVQENQITEAAEEKPAQI